MSAGNATRSMSATGSGCYAQNAMGSAKPVRDYAASRGMTRLAARSRRDRLLDDRITCVGTMRLLAQHATIRARARQALIQAENVPADVLQAIAAREMRFDIRP